jgi:putative transposase
VRVRRPITSPDETWSGATGVESTVESRTMEFRRKNIRLPADQYRGRRVYFLTLCCYQRRPFFRNIRFAKWLVREIEKHAAAHRFALHAWTVMPDHVHILFEGVDHGCDLLTLTSRLKRRTSTVVRMRRNVKLWQGKFYDHILRTSDSMDGVAWYIWMNPVRKGLCSAVEEYPFSGSATIEWRRVSRPNTEWRPPWRSV